MDKKDCFTCKYQYNNVYEQPCSDCEYLDNYFSEWQTVDNSINHPSHYTQGGIECIDAIKAALTPDEFRGYIKGTILKYIWREKLKNGDEDLKKAEWFLNYFIKNMEDGNE